MENSGVCEAAAQELRPDTCAKMEIVLSAMWVLPSNGQTVTSSLRDIQKLTGLGRGTVAAALKRCVEAGWISAVGNSQRSKWWRAADSYRLLKPPIAKPSFLWSQAGLGVTSLLILMSMSPNDWMTTADIASAANAAPRTARKYLRHLHSAGLVDKRGRGLWLRLDDQEYFHYYEELLVGQVKRNLRLLVLEQQAEWAGTIDSCPLDEPQRGHSDRNRPSRRGLLGQINGPSAKPLSEADGYSQSAEPPDCQGMGSHLSDPFTCSQSLEAPACKPDGPLLSGT